MSVFTMVVLIVLIATIGKIYDTHQKTKVRQHNSGSDSVESRRLQAEVVRLNERIAVLERLATDPSQRLADEIDRLKTLPDQNSNQETDDAQR